MEKSNKIGNKGNKIGKKGNNFWVNFVLIGKLLKGMQI